MSRDALSLSDYLANITQAIDRIQKYTADGDQDTFVRTPLLHDAVIRNLGIVGEISHTVAKHYPAFTAANPGLALVAAYEMSHTLRHGDMNLVQVWDTVQHRLPDMARQVERVSQDLAHARDTGQHSPLTLPSRPTASVGNMPASDARDVAHDRHTQHRKLKPSEALERHREAIRQIVGAHRALNPRVFGSVLHGQDHEESDLDLLVDPLANISLLDIGAMQHALRDLLGVPVDVVTPDDLPDRWRDRVIAEAKPV